MGGRIISFLKAHWQGRIALLPTLILSLLGLRLGIDMLSAARPAGWPLALALTATLGSGLVLIWQLVGGLRATARARDVAASLGGVLALVATGVLFLSTELGYWATRGALPLALPVPPAPYRIADGAVSLKGEISYLTLKRLEATLAARSGALRRVDLESAGGHVPAARALAQRIESAGLDTRAVGLCASACTLVFMAGKARSLGPEGALGFHAYRIDRTDPMHELAAEEERDRAYLSGRGVTEEFLSRVFSTPPDRLWQPGRDELLSGGLLTR